jgi:sugar-specific transcriptional regulator TrmB
MYAHNLESLGLSPSQAELYEILIKNGPITANRLAQKSALSRTHAYKTLKELEVMGLVRKGNEKVTVFYPVHPQKLRSLVEKREKIWLESKASLEPILGKLISDFNTISGQPGIRILEGISGIEELYEDILNEKSPIYLIRSPRDNDQPELKKIVADQVTEQAKLGISAKVIAPLMPNTPLKVIEGDEKNLVERRIVPREQFDIPAQIILYKDKVAITAYDKEIITTIIENSAIRKTFECIFNYIWTAAEPEHMQIMSKIKNGN